MSLEVKFGVTGWVEVGDEVQNCLKREAEVQEVLKSIVTVVVATIMTAGKLEVAIPNETDILKETPENKQGILPLREGMEKETVVTTETEIKDQVHRFDIREGVTSWSVMTEERSEEWTEWTRGEMTGPERETGNGSGRESGSARGNGSANEKKKESSKESVLENGRERGRKKGIVRERETGSMTARGRESVSETGRKNESERGKKERGRERESGRESESGNGSELEKGKKSESDRESGKTKTRVETSAERSGRISEKTELSGTGTTRGKQRSAIEMKGAPALGSPPSADVSTLLTVTPTTVETIKTKSTDS